MTLTIYRSTRSIYRGDWLCITWEEFALEPTLADSWDSTRRVADRGGGPEIETTFTHLRSPPEKIVVVTPSFTRIVDQVVADMRVGRRVAFPSEEGLGIESIFNLATRGDRGFSLAVFDSCEVESPMESPTTDNGQLTTDQVGPLTTDKTVKQASLFDDDASLPPVGAYGPAKKRSKFAAVAESLRDYAASPPAETNWSVAVPGAVGNRIVEEPAGEPRLERAEPGPIVAVEPDVVVKLRAYSEFLATDRNTLVVAVARASGCLPEDPKTAGRILDEARAEIAAGRRAAARPFPVQAAIDLAGLDLVGDVDHAIAEIRLGGGMNAIQILRKVRHVLAGEGS
jgi:hypothetical protein